MQESYPFSYSKTKQEDIQAMIITHTHLCAKNWTDKMTPYVFARKQDGVNIIHLEKTWQKLMIAARILASIKNPEDILIVGSKEYAQRPVMKFAQHVGCRYITTKWIGGTLTNYIIKQFVEPRIVIVADPTIDYGAITEATYVNIPVIALWNTDNNLKNINLAIPCNNKGKESLAIIFYLLAREIKYLKNEIPREKKTENEKG